MIWIHEGDADGVKISDLEPNSFAVVLRSDVDWLVGDIVYRDTVDTDLGRVHNLRDNSHCSAISVTDDCRYKPITKPFTLCPKEDADGHI